MRAFEDGRWVKEDGRWVKGVGWIFLTQRAQRFFYVDYFDGRKGTSFS